MSLCSPLLCVHVLGAGGWAGRWRGYLGPASFRAGINICSERGPSNYQLCWEVWVGGSDPVRTDSTTELLRAGVGDCWPQVLLASLPQSPSASFLPKPCTSEDLQGLGWGNPVLGSLPSDFQMVLWTPSFREPPVCWPAKCCQVGHGGGWGGERAWRRLPLLFLASAVFLATYLTLACCQGPR